MHSIFDLSDQLLNSFNSLTDVILFGICLAYCAAQLAAMGNVAQSMSKLIKACRQRKFYLMQKMIWFICGMLSGLTALSITKASVPLQGKVTDDTALYQRLSEIRVPKEDKVNFDADIQQLSQMESRFHENLPSVSKNSRMRISRQ